MSTSIYICEVCFYLVKICCMIVHRYMDWVFNKYSMERKDDIKCLLIKSFVEAFKMDAEAPRLKEFSVVFEISFSFA